MRYELDEARSVLEIHASSTVHPIRTSTRVRGWIDVTLDASGSVEVSAQVRGYVELDLSGMRSGNPLVDRESERRLDVRRHPTVTGELTALSATEEPGVYSAEGELTFHGVTRRIDGVLRLGRDDAEPGNALRVAGETTIDVTDFGVQPPSLIVIKVHRRVRVELRAVATPPSTGAHRNVR